MWLPPLFLALQLARVESGGRTVFYADDGAARSVPTPLPQGDAEALEEQIWQLLGLSGQPGQRRQSPPPAADPAALAGMLRLYQHLREEDDNEAPTPAQLYKDPATTGPLCGVNFDILHQADTVISFANNRASKLSFKLSCKATLWAVVNG